MHFFFIDTSTTMIYTLSLHDALPISEASPRSVGYGPSSRPEGSRWQRPLPLSGSTTRLPTPTRCEPRWTTDRKSSRLNSSHGYISYAVFCLKKKKQDIHKLTKLHST